MISYTLQKSEEDKLQKFQKTTEKVPQNLITLVYLFFSSQKNAISRILQPSDDKFVDSKTLISPKWAFWNIVPQLREYVTKFDHSRPTFSLRFIAIHHKI